MTRQSTVTRGLRCWARLLVRPSVRALHLAGGVPAAEGQAGEQPEREEGRSGERGQAGRLGQSLLRRGRDRCRARAGGRLADHRSGALLDPGHGSGRCTGDCGRYNGRLLEYGCDRVDPLRFQLRVRPGIPPLPSWRRCQRSSIRSIIRARLVGLDRRFVPFAVVVPAPERAGRIPATYRRRQLTAAHTRDSSTITTPTASR